MVEEIKGKEEKEILPKKVDEPEKKNAPVAEPKKETVSKEEMLANIEKARKEEKDKLYPELEKAKGLVSEKEEVIKKLADEIEVKKVEVDEAKKSKMTTEEKLAALDANMKTEIEKIKGAREEDKKEAAEKIRLEKLNSYREEKLRLAGGEIIPELVAGNSEEKIDESIKKAQKKYKEIYSAAEKAAKGIPLPKITEPGKGVTPEITKETIKNISAEAWRKMKPEDRAKIRAAAKNL